MNYDNTNTGVLFPEDKTGKHEKFPDYTGKINVNGVDKRLAAWEREGRNGTFLSIKVDDFKSEPHTAQSGSGYAKAKARPRS